MKKSQIKINQIKKTILTPTLLIYSVSTVVILSIIILVASKEINALSNDYLTTVNELYSNKGKL